MARWRDLSIFCAVPVYHFHLRNAHVEARDEEGLDLPGVDAAREQALMGIRDFLGHELRTGIIDLRGHVEIADECGETLQTIPFSDAVEIIPA